MADDARHRLGRADGPDARRGIVALIVQSWWAPRRVVAHLAPLSEGAMLAVLLGAMLVFLISQAPQHSRQAVLDPSIPFEARMGGSVLAVMFLMPLLAYLVAAVMVGLVRLTGWRLDGPDARLSLFWALLAVAPAMLLAGLVAGLIGPGPALTMTRTMAGLGFLMIWGAGIVALARRK